MVFPFATLFSLISKPSGQDLRDQQCTSDLASFRHQYGVGAAGCGGIHDFYANFLGVEMKDQKAIFVSRIIVGKLSRQTPEMSSEVTRIILNPDWTVPPGIARRNIIPQILKNRAYLQSHKMKIFSIHEPNKALDPDAVDWLAVARNPARYVLRQDPGPHNALGQIKFYFSNSHAVYLHDTPAKHLFDEEKRLFTSGCVRVENPLDLLDELIELYPSMQQSESQMESALSSGKTVAIPLKEPIPLYVTYFTAWVDHAGTVHFWDDVYGRDVSVLNDSV